eukprot:TRINITY_DN17577_c0_g2_i1.p1 TRINITY_DN17577_c0_g2~~TRINITY_DN17577_c0_g2_i1.p1  ORF type:complete len:653 (-),score=70.63 TRINITY_DN17577_c0_g2_i1:780-2684(-)
MHGATLPVREDADCGRAGTTESALPVLIDFASPPTVTGSPTSTAWKSEDTVSDANAALCWVDGGGGSQQWDYYLCHAPSNGQDGAMLLGMILAEKLPGVKCWIDLKQDLTEQRLHDGVRNSQNFILLLTADVFESNWVLQELEWAMTYKKNIVLVQETDEQHGKPIIEDLTKTLPSRFLDLFHMNVAIPFMREPEFRDVSVGKIIRASILSRLSVRLLQEHEDISPLMFKAKSLHENDEVVFDPWFVTFTIVCGIALPGSGRKSRCWSRSVQNIILLCGIACASRLFTTEGPAYMDHETILQIVVAHPVVYVFKRVTLRVLSSHCVKDMLENHIDAGRDARRLRLKIRRATALSLVLTTGFTCWAWIAYLPGFFAHWYVVPSDRAIEWAVFGIFHGTIWIVVLPLFFGSLFCCVLMLFVIQELAYMNIVTCFHDLHTRICERGLEAMLESGETLSLTHGSLYRFQLALNSAYQRYQKLHRLAVPAYLVFWVLQLLFLPWSLRSLAKGFQAAQGEEEVHTVARLQQHWFLVVRLTFFSGGSLFFGLPQWLVALQPWGSHHYSWRMRRIRSRIMLDEPHLLPVFMTILDRVDARFRVGVLDTALRLMPLYLAILAVNTAGWNAYAARLLVSTYTLA